MGNSNKRSSTQSTDSQRTLSSSNTSNGATLIKVDWKSEPYISHLIAERKLAPKISTSSANRDAECPICFLDFEYLNTAVCCKQSICTDCAVSIKRGTQPGATAACPFCGHTSMVITFSEKIASSAKKVDSGGSAPAVQSPSSPMPVAPTSYVTPEQERKLRSLSADGTSIAVSASKLAREALEKQIKNQRSQYQEEDEQDLLLRQTSYSAATRSSGRQSRSGAGRSASYNGSSARYHSNSARGSAAGNSVRAGLHDPALMSTIQNLLDSANMQSVGSIEELEELMFMEALRQSVNEGAQTDAAGDLALPAPPSAASNSEGGGNAKNSATSSSNSSSLDSNHARDSGVSRESEFEEEEEEQEEEEDRDGEYSGEEESEDEELRLALEMSILSAAEVSAAKAPDSLSSKEETSSNRVLPEPPKGHRHRARTSSSVRSTSNDLGSLALSASTVPHRIQDGLDGVASPVAPPLPPQPVDNVDSGASTATPPSSPQRLIDLIQEALDSPLGSSRMGNPPKGEDESCSLDK